MEAPVTSTRLVAVCILMAAATAIGGTPRALAQDTPPRPHILHVVSDDQGWKDVGLHGSDINTGGNGDVGIARMTDDIAKVIAQVPPMVESLTGLIKLDQLIERVGAAAHGRKHSSGDRSPGLLRRVEGP